MGVNGQCVQRLCLPAWEGDNCTYMYTCVGVLSMVMHAVVDLEALWRPTRVYWNYCAM